METFKPEFVLVSAGFDGHKGDPLGGLTYSADSYAANESLLGGSGVDGWSGGGMNYPACGGTVSIKALNLLQTKPEFASIPSLQKEFSMPATPAISSVLQTPIRIGAWDLPNRIMMAPLTRCRASEGRVPNELMADYYSQRAGAGLILTEATSVDPSGVGYPDTPGIWSQTQVEGWKKVTDAVHKKGGRILLQLWHVGRISDPIYLNLKVG